MVTVEENEFRLTASGAGKMLGLTPAGVLALSNRGVLPCVRDSVNRRLYAPRDVAALLEKRQAAHRSKTAAA